MNQMNSDEYLQQQIKERLAGDEKHISELFVDSSVFDKLVVLGKDSDWYHYSKKTFDGWYLVKTGTGYAAYYQDRGAISEHNIFDKLQDAAGYFFQASGYIRS